MTMRTILVAALGTTPSAWRTPDHRSHLCAILRLWLLAFLMFQSEASSAGYTWRRKRTRFAFPGTHLSANAGQTLGGPCFDVLRTCVSSFTSLTHAGFSCRRYNI